jgi:hypothetical protein
MQSLLRPYTDCDVDRTCKPQIFIRDQPRSNHLKQDAAFRIAPMRLWSTRHVHNNNNNKPTENNIFTDGGRSGGATIFAPQTITITARKHSYISKTGMTYKIGELLISDQYQTYTESANIMLAMATIRAMQTRKLTGLVLIWAASTSGSSSSSVHPQ